ncbi:MAG TPA: DUF169 domain-containing protein [Candidatus Deferrimicrobiaceae bacterium]|nr:DUF169 domain-containing protein [Candidatus Deferrimicrobiaceae bacterium]
MKTQIETFMKAFGTSEYPILFRYADELPKGTLLPPKGARTCLFALLAKTRTEGTPVAFSATHHGCRGGGYYLGFLDTPREGIEYFLSCGIPGEMEGERYVKTPDLARAKFAGMPVRPAPKRYGLFTRADMPHTADDPEVVVFFATPDLLAGLHFLASFDREGEAVTAPFSSGCGAIVTFPLQEGTQPDPRAVLGLFDPSARPYVEENLLTFTVPFGLFGRMAENIPESFLTTRTWGTLRKRIRG